MLNAGMRFGVSKDDRPPNSLTGAPGIRVGCGGAMASPGLLASTPPTAVKLAKNCRREVVPGLVSSLILFSCANALQSHLVYHQAQNGSWKAF